VSAANIKSRSESFLLFSAKSLFSQAEKPQQTKKDIALSRCPLFIQ
jgi:hypothetical protein